MAIETLIRQLIEQAPWAAAGLIIIVLFLRAMTRREQLFCETVRAQSKEQHEVQRETVQAIRENTAIVSETKGVMEGLKLVVERTNGH